MHGGEVVVKTMISCGVDTVFFVAGETITTVFEALSRHQREMRWMRWLFSPVRAEDRLGERL